MGLILRLAWRNVWRNPRRTALTVAATVFAVVLVVFSVAMSTGTHEKMIEDSVRIGSGHAQVTGKGFVAKQTLEQFVRYDPGLEHAIGEVPHVVGHAPRVQSFGLLSRDSSTYDAATKEAKPVAHTRVSAFCSAKSSRRRAKLATEARRVATRLAASARARAHSTHSRAARA